MILVLVGMHATVPFDRLITEMDRIAGLRILGEDVLIQKGCSAYDIKYAESVDYLGIDEVESILDSCSVVVSHAGMGSILDARRHGKPIVVLPRRSELKEAIDNHQIETIQHLRKEDGVFVAESEKDLLERIIAAKEMNVERPSRDDSRNGFLDYLHQIVEGYDWIDRGN